MSASESEFAFPSGDFTGYEPSSGMTLRDWFAGQALAGMMAAGKQGAQWWVSEEAYRLADAMLAARGETVR